MQSLKFSIPYTSHCMTRSVKAHLGKYYSHCILFWHVNLKSLFPTCKSQLQIHKNQLQLECSFVPQIFNCNMTLTCNVSSQSLLPPRYTGLHYCCLAIKEIFVPIGNACLDEGLLFLWNAAGNTCFSSITLALNPGSSATTGPKSKVNKK